MKHRILTAALAALFLLPLMCGTAFATVESGQLIEDSENDDPALSILNSPLSIDTDWIGLETEPPIPPIEYRPFTPSGTGTVIDQSTDADGKEFYTITTPDEHVFYLVIDKQRNMENVYFLNAVTVDDLLALAENAEPAQGGMGLFPPQVAPSEIPVETTEPEPLPAPPIEQQQQGGNSIRTYIIMGVVAVIGGGAGWYFKIYRPKQQGAKDGDEYEPPADDDCSGGWDEEQDGGER